MKTPYLAERYHFDKKAQVVYKESIISRKKVKELNENEVLNLIDSGDIQIGVNEEQDRLDWIEKGKNKELFDKLKGHINSWDNQKEASEFENGYCYFAELWKMKYGEKLIILYYRH